jgi:hypothetical protein
MPKRINTAERELVKLRGFRAGLDDPRLAGYDGHNQYGREDFSGVERTIERILANS